MEKSFETFKDYILTKAKEKDACSSEFTKAENSTNYSQLLEIINNNAYWCYNTKLVDADILEKYVPDEELVSASIYVKKENVIQTESLCFYYSSTSEHYGSSTSKHYGSSTSKHYDSSTSEHYYSSTSKHYGSSTSKHYDSSTSEHYYSSTFGSVYTLKDKSIIHDRAIVRERSTNKVYFKKSAFEIIELD